MTLPKAQQILNRNKIKIHPIGEYINDNLYHFYIYKNDKKYNKKIVVRPKQKNTKKEYIGFDDLNDSLTKTIIFEANKIKQNL